MSYKHIYSKNYQFQLKYQLWRSIGQLRPKKLIRNFERSNLTYAKKLETLSPTPVSYKKNWVYHKSLFCINWKLCNCILWLPFLNSWMFHRAWVWTKVSIRNSIGVRAHIRVTVQILTLDKTVSWKMCTQCSSCAENMKLRI